MIQASIGLILWEFWRILVLENYLKGPRKQTEQRCQSLVPVSYASIGTSCF
uniref:Uncharacterized protein n=1 Tax=Setaria viridis TaxID=4556 RepID=A0A4U6UG83_SETVI|nr:hypothetical protein SEVIR_5G131625v2 [Setaria viridis]